MSPADTSRTVGLANLAARVNEFGGVRLSIESLRTTRDDVVQSDAFVVEVAQAFRLPLKRVEALDLADSPSLVN